MLRCPAVAVEQCEVMTGAGYRSPEIAKGLVMASKSSLEWLVSDNAVSRSKPHRATMKCHSMGRVFLLLSGIVAFLMTPVLAAPSDAGWNTLKMITHRKHYTFVRRDGTCLEAQIRSVKQDRVHLRVQQSLSHPAYETSLARVDIVRITDGRMAAHDTVFSAKSSWTDIKEANPQGRLEHLLIILKSGNQYKSKRAKVSDKGITVEGQEQQTEIAKSQVERVFYVRLKPISDDAEYAIQEAVPVPEIWFGGALLGTIPVLLYDASLPEDNSPITCRVWS
jgi:hypothetical protein